MDRYQKELETNINTYGLPENQMVDEWKLLKETKYKYDPTYNYAPEALRHLTAFYKREGNLQYELVAKMALFDTNIPDKSLHKTSYTYWLDAKWLEFKRDYNPEKKHDGLNYLWLTFNFKDDTPIEKVKKDMERIVNHSIFSKCRLTYCYEYYTQQGHHPHVHMLVEMQRTGTIAPSDIQDNLITKVKGLNKYLTITWYYSWATGKNIGKRCKSRDIYNAYCLGNKKVLKNENSAQDREWRLTNNLEDLYIKENL